MRNPKQPIPSDLRRKVFKRDGYTCQYCGAKGVPLHADHVYPESKGGETTLANLVAACAHCNHQKHAKVGVWPRKILFTDVVVEKLVIKEVIVEKPVIVEKQVIVEKERPAKDAPDWILHAAIVTTLIPCTVIFIPFARQSPWNEIVSSFAVIAILLYVFEFGWNIGQKYGR